MRSTVRVLVIVGLVSLAAISSAFAQTAEEQKIATWLAGYDAALNARNLDTLGTFITRTPRSSKGQV